MIITDEQFSDALRLAVLEKGADYHYPQKWMDDDGSCYYRMHGKPACIVGTALAILGIETTRNDEGTSASKVLERFGLSEDVRLAADDAQVTQDQGKSWGEAIEQYDRSLGVVQRVPADKKKILLDF